MTYIDAFLAPISSGNKDAYLKHAEQACEVFKEYGALQVIEAWEDDIPEGELTSMPMAVQRQEGEELVMSWVFWPSKAHRDEAWGQLMQDERMQGEMPFDGKRMIFGGFEQLFSR